MVRFLWGGGGGGAGVQANEGRSLEIRGEAAVPIQASCAEVLDRSGRKCTGAKKEEGLDVVNSRRMCWYCGCSLCAHGTWALHLSSLTGQPLSRAD